MTAVGFSLSCQLDSRLADRAELLLCSAADDFALLSEVFVEQLGETCGAGSGRILRKDHLACVTHHIGDDLAHGLLLLMCA
ncbi:MAG: hypothetical protein EBQ80_02585 [Proteobacteria bacterium]|nr:hypothetical protein [Pseudomonadota bacterium]